MTITHEPTALDAQKLEFCGQLLTASTGALEVASMHVGLDLGLYTAVRRGLTTGPELAERCGIHPRYAREWLEQQWASGVIDVDDPAADPDARRFSLPEAHAQVLLDEDDPAYLGPALAIVSSFTAAREAVTEAFRTGGGVTYGDYGHGTRHGVGAANRAIYLHGIAEWLALAGIDRRLATVDAPKVADLGCGTGWSTIVLGAQLPTASIVGVDLDQRSVEDARANVQGEGRSAQIAIRRGDAAELDGGPYDLVTMFQMLHDSADPVGVLAAAKAHLAPGGEVLVADEATADEFGTARGELTERFQYGCSVLHCLPATMAEDPVEATGNVIRPATIRRYAEAAGFGEVEELAVTPGFFRVYLIR